MGTLKRWAVRGARAVVLGLMTIFLCSEHVAAYVSLGSNLFMSNDSLGRPESGFMDNIVYSTNLTYYSGMPFYFVKSDVVCYTENKRGDYEYFPTCIQFVGVSPLFNTFFADFNIVLVNNMLVAFDCISERGFFRYFFVYYSLNGIQARQWVNHHQWMRLNIFGVASSYVIYFDGNFKSSIFSFPRNFANNGIDRQPSSLLLDKERPSLIVGVNGSIGGSDRCSGRFLSFPQGVENKQYASAGNEQRAERSPKHTFRPEGHGLLGGKILIGALAVAIALWVGIRVGVLWIAGQGVEQMLSRPYIGLSKILLGSAVLCAASLSASAVIIWLIRIP